MRRRELDILYVATRAVLLFWLAPYISDLPLYQSYARNLIPDGKWPYVGFEFEYPPLAYPLIAAPAWLLDALGRQDTESYRLLFGLCLLPFDFLLYRAFRRRPPVRGAAFLYVMLTGALGLLLFDRFDLLVGFLVAWPFVRGEDGSDARFGASWGLGGALKLVPLLLAPALVGAWAGSLRERAARLARFALLTLGPIALCLAGVALAAHGKISFLSRHSDRGVQIESLVGSVVMFLKSFTGLIEMKVEWNYGAQHLSPLPGATTASRALFVGSLLLTYAALATTRFRRDPLAGAWLLLSAFVTFGYVLSPQYLLWLVPLAILATARVPAGWRRSCWIALFSGAVAVTGTHFRYYWDYVNLHQAAVLMVLGRNLALVGLWGLSWAWMVPRPREPIGEPAPARGGVVGPGHGMLSSAHDAPGSP